MAFIKATTNSVKRRRLFEILGPLFTTRTAVNTESKVRSHNVSTLWPLFYFENKEAEIPSLSPWTRWPRSPRTAVLVVYSFYLRLPSCSWRACEMRDACRGGLVSPRGAPAAGHASVSKVRGFESRLDSWSFGGSSHVLEYYFLIIYLWRRRQAHRGGDIEAVRSALPLRHFTPPLSLSRVSPLI